MTDMNQAYIAGVYYPMSTTTYLNLSDTALSYGDIIAISGLENLTYLNLNNTQTDDVSTLAKLQGLTILSLSGNRITDPSPLAELTRLTYLDLRNNPLNREKLELLENRISMCNINYSTFAADRNTPVAIGGEDHFSLDTTSLEFTDTELTKEDCAGISKLVNLSEITITRCKIADIGAFGGCPSLKRLILNEVDPYDLRLLSRLKNLDELCVYNSHFSNLAPLAELTSLTMLSLNVNDIEDISPLAGLTNLNFLALNANSVSDISPLSQLTQLTKLELWGNRISDLSPLVSLVYLNKLNLFDNQVKELSPLANHISLVKLNLKKNLITDITPLANLKKLKDLYLVANPILPEQREKQRRVLPNCNIWW